MCHDRFFPDGVHPTWTVRKSGVRSKIFTVGVVFAAGMALVTAPAAQSNPCNDASCTPGVATNVALGAPCENTTYFVFATTDWDRIVFCGSPRRYAPRYFRSPPMMGVKDLGADCVGYENDVAQAPDGLFLTCTAASGATIWERGDT